MTYRWPKPEGIPTALTLPEMELLQTYAAEAHDVMEIGTHFGYSCIGMALAGAFVWSYDPHYEGPANAPDTWGPFLANLTRHGVRGQVMPFREAVTEGWHKPWRWGLVHIDGDHVWPCPMRDAEIALAHLQAPGYIAFHDVTPRWPGVWRAAQELEESGRVRKLAQAGTLAVYQAYQKYVSTSP